jgi:hypothetical protein
LTDKAETRKREVEMIRQQNQRHSDSLTDLRIELDALEKHVYTLD